MSNYLLTVFLLLFVAFLLFFYNTEARASQTVCQQQGVYTDCTTTDDYNLGRHTDTQCQRQGAYTDCNTTFDNRNDDNE